MAEVVQAILPYSRTIRVKTIGAKRLVIKEPSIQFYACIIIGDPIVIPDSLIPDHSIDPRDYRDPDEEYDEESFFLTSGPESDRLHS